MMQDKNENRNTGNKCHVLENLKVVSSTGSHAYTTLSFAALANINERSLDPFSTKYPYIQNINVSNNVLRTMKNISKFKNLKCLNASHNKLSKFDMNVEWDIYKNTGNKSLLQLNVSHNMIRNLGCLSQHIHIEILDLSHNNLRKIDELHSLNLLQKLNISHNNISDLSPLQNLPIIDLDASHNNIDTIENISAEHIKICNLNNNKITNLDSANQFRHLTEFYICKNNISDFETFNNLTTLPLLRILDAQNNPIECKEDLPLKIIYLLPALEHLNGKIVDSKAKIEAKFRHRAFNTTLSSIEQYYQNDDQKFDDNQNKMAQESENEFWYRIVEEGFAIFWEKFMTKFPSLSTTTIDLSHLQIGNAGLHSVSDIIQECDNLTNLILRNTLSSERWSDTADQWPLKYLCNALVAANNTLTYLDLSHCCIDAIKFEPIGYLIENCYLITLNLNGNNIGQHTFDDTETNIIKPCPAIKVLTKSILKSKSLIKLCINRNNIDAMGAYLIGKCLQNEQCPLQDFDISYNVFGMNGNGFAEIAKSIAINTCLQVLDMSYCIQNSDSAQYMEPLCHSLKQNKHIQHLNISGNILSESAMKYLSLAIQMNTDIQCLKMKDIIIDNEPFNSVLSVIANKRNFSELSMDIQSPKNMKAVIHSISNHTNLKSLSLSNIRRHKCNTSELQLQSNIIQQSLSTLVTLDLSKLCISAQYTHQILDALYQRNECLTNLNLESSELDKKCWNSLTQICNKLSLKQLNISQCSINDDCDTLHRFFESKAVTQSIIDLNMSNINWNDHKPLSIFTKLFSELKQSENKRQFDMNLTQFPFHADIVMNNKHYMHQLFTVLSRIGVTALVLDTFMIADSMSISCITLIKEMFHCFAQNRYNIQSLSINLQINISSEDATTFATLLNSVKLRKLSLPKINNKEMLRKLLSNLGNRRLKVVELRNEIDKEDMDVLLSMKRIDSPQIVVDKFIDTSCKAMDHKLNQYMSEIVVSNL